MDWNYHLSTLRILAAKYGKHWADWLVGQHYKLENVLWLPTPSQHSLCKMVAFQTTTGSLSDDHLLHDIMEKSTHRKIPKSRRPLTHHAQQLVSSVCPQDSANHRTLARWAESWASTTTRLHKFIPTPSNSGQGVGLSRRAWTQLNRLRTGVGRFGANMLRWGLSTSDCCDCGAEQTADHITSGRCPIHRPPEGMHGLIELDVQTRTWLENSAPDVWWVCDGTREKKHIIYCFTHWQHSICCNQHHLLFHTLTTHHMLQLTPFTASHIDNTPYVAMNTIRWFTHWQHTICCNEHHSLLNTLTTHHMMKLTPSTISHIANTHMLQLTQFNA